MSCTGARGVGASLVICDGQAADGARGVEAREALRPRHARSLLACAALRGHSARGCAHYLRTANDAAALRPLWLWKGYRTPQHTQWKGRGGKAQPVERGNEECGNEADELGDAGCRPTSTSSRSSGRPARAERPGPPILHKPVPRRSWPLARRDLSARLRLVGGSVFCYCAIF